VAFTSPFRLISLLKPTWCFRPDVRDWIFIPAHMSMPAIGPFEVLDVDTYHDGRARLSLRLAQIDEPRPANP
jgi:hypothetical protein